MSNFNFEKYVSVAAAIMLGLFETPAETYVSIKPEFRNQEKLFTEQDVIDSIKLPVNNAVDHAIVHTEIDFSRLKSYSDPDFFLKDIVLNPSGNTVFAVLTDKAENEFKIQIEKADSFHSLCQTLLKGLLHSYSLWSEIPKEYLVSDHDGIYVLESQKQPKVIFLNRNGNVMIMISGLANESSELFTPQAVKECNQKLLGVADKIFLLLTGARGFDETSTVSLPSHETSERIQNDGAPPPSEVAEPAPRSAAELPPQGLEVSLTEPTQLPDDFFTDQLKQLEDIKDKNAANCLAIAEIYFYGRKGIPVAKAKAVAYYRQAYDLAEAELSRNASDAQALYIAGLSAEKLLNGIDFMSCLKKAADAGYAPAEAELAFRYMKGIGMEADFNNAYEYALKASEQGNMFGRGLLGSYYVVVKKDLKEGLRLLQESAEAGDPGGQYMLFYCLKYMPGLVRNDALAMELLRLRQTGDFPMP